jgi:hypothetical protein
MAKKHKAGSRKSPSPAARKKYGQLVTKAAERTLIATAKHDPSAARRIISKAQSHL